MPRRLAITGPYRAEILTYPEPQISADQVLVQTEFASGTHGAMTALFEDGVFGGQYFDPKMRLFVEADGKNARKQPSQRNPWNMGSTGVGTVTAVGADVTRFAPGDRVFGFMDTREVNVCAAQDLWRLGDIDPYLALCLEPAYIAFHCVRESMVRFGDSVLVVGLGALGLLAVRMARESGAELVIGVDPYPRRRKLAKQFGADYVLDPAVGDVAQMVHGLTNGPGVDVAIELAGVYHALETAIRSTRVAGTVCSAGMYQGEAHGMWLGREWHHNRLNLIVPHGCGTGHPPRDYPRWDERRAYDAIIAMMRKGRLTAPGLINLVLSAEEGTQVFERMRTDPDQVIKYAIRF